MILRDIMKTWLILWMFVALVLPGLAKEPLKPEPLTQEVREYSKAARTGSPNDTNHVIWKLYIYEPIYPERGTPDRLLAGLTSDSTDPFYVMLNIALLWDSLNRTPQPGDVLVVEGHIQDRNKNLLIRRMNPKLGEVDEYPWNYLTLFSENAEVLAGQPEGPQATPVVTPAASPTPTLTPQVGKAP